MDLTHSTPIPLCHGQQCSVLNRVSLGVIQVDPLGRVFYLSPWIRKRWPQTLELPGKIQELWKVIDLEGIEDPQRLQLEKEKIEQGAEVLVYLLLHGQLGEEHLMMQSFQDSRGMVMIFFPRPEKNLEKELQREKDLFSTSAQALGEGMLILDQQGKIIQSNSAAKTLLEEWGVPLSQMNFLHPSSPFFHQNGTPFQLRELPAYKAIEKGQSVRSVVAGFQGERENWTWFLMNAEPLTTEEKEGARCVLTLMDITQRVEKEASLKKLVESKNRFIALLSHDLRGPLSGLNRLATMALAQFHSISPDKFKDYLQAIQEASESTYHLVENLLIMTLSEGDIHWKPDALQVKEILEDVADGFSFLYTEKDLELGWDVDCNDPVWGESSMVAAILRNLLANAYKFTPSKGRVWVSLEKEGQYLKVHVKDTGVGIPKKKVKLLFSGDRKNSSLGTRNEKGTGLGLKLCKDLAEKMGGRITVRSEEGKGSSFFLFLPLVEGIAP